jgi:hypothetical protein
MNVPDLIDAMSLRKRAASGRVMDEFAAAFLGVAWRGRPREAGFMLGSGCRT